MRLLFFEKKFDVFDIKTKSDNSLSSKAFLQLAQAVAIIRGPPINRLITGNRLNGR